MFQQIGLILCCLIVAVQTQSILFPHGYFDSNKISAVDAFYLNMLAISTIENNGITINDLDDLTASRIAPEKLEPGSLKEKVHQVELEKEKVNLAVGTPIVIDERPKESANPGIVAPALVNEKKVGSEIASRGIGVPVAVSEPLLGREKERPLTKDNRPPAPFKSRGNFLLLKYDKFTCP